MNQLNDLLMFPNSSNINSECSYCHQEVVELEMNWVSLTIDDTLILHFCHELHMCLYMIESDNEVFKMYGYEQMSSMK